MFYNHLINLANKLPPSWAITLNETTNKIYLKNGTAVTAIDGITNTASVITAVTGLGAAAITANPVTNNVFVNDYDSTITVINGSPESIRNVGPQKQITRQRTYQTVFNLQGRAFANVKTMPAGVYFGAERIGSNNILIKKVIFP